MKSNHWLLCALIGITAASALAQDAKPAAAPKPGAALSSDIVLDPPQSATIKAEVLNVRDQPALTADVIARQNRGDGVTVYETMTLSKPKSGEPASWSRISLATNAAAWVFADYVDNATMTAKRRLNVRGGPGENFKSLAVLAKGAAVTEVRRSQGWIQILPPTNAFGFVDAEYLAMSPASPPTPAPPPANVAVAAPPPSAVPPATVTTAPSPAPPPPDTNAIAATAPGPAVPAAIIAPAPSATEPVAVPPVAPPAPPPVTPPVPPPAAPALADGDAQPRLVTREGYVRKALNIQAPTDFELMEVETGNLTEYLQTKDKKFSSYLGAHVTVTGPEVLDSRWPKTPVLQVQSIVLLP